MKGNELLISLICFLRAADWQEDEMASKAAWLKHKTFTAQVRMEFLIG